MTRKGRPDKRDSEKRPTAKQIAEYEESEQANPDDLEEGSSTQPEPTGSQEQSPDDLE